MGKHGRMEKLIHKGLGRFPLGHNCINSYFATIRSTRVSSLRLKDSFGGHSYYQCLVCRNILDTTVESRSGKTLVFFPSTQEVVPWETLQNDYEVIALHGKVNT